jgi:hypothetical protein
MKVGYRPTATFVFSVALGDVSLSSEYENGYARNISAIEYTNYIRHRIIQKK